MVILNIFALFVNLFPSLVVSNEQLRGNTSLEMAHVQQYVNFADQELLPAVATWVFPTLGLMQYNKQVIRAYNMLNSRGEVLFLAMPRDKHMFLWLAVPAT